MSHKKKLIINFGSLSMLKIATYIFPLIYLPYLLKIVGPSRFGAIAFAQAIVLYFNLITNLGTNLYAPREIAINKNNHFEICNIVSNILFLRLVALLVAIIIYFITIYTISKFREESLLFIISSGFLIIKALKPSWFFQGIEKMVNIAMANFLSGALGIFLIFIFINKETDYIYVPLTNILSQMLGLIFMYYIMFNKEKIKIIKPDIILMKKIFKESIPLFVSNISSGLHTGINTVMLGFLSNNSIVGYYSIAYKIIIAGLSIQSQLGNVFYPHISQMFLISKEKAIKSIKKAFIVTMLFAIPITMFIFNNGNEIVKLLFGDEFFMSIIPIKILSFLFIIRGLSNVFGKNILLPFNKKREFMKPILTAAIINLVLNFLLIPVLKQNGASLAFLGSEIWVTFWMYLEIKKINISLFDLNILLRLLSIVSCLFIFVFIFKYIRTSLILNGIMYFFVYGLLLIIFRLIDVKNKTITF